MRPPEGARGNAVERVPAADTFALRQRILRPHESLADLALPGDDDPDTAHFAVRENGDVVGTASVRRERAPWTDEPAAWRLRGMATTERRRRRGVGTALVQAVIDHVGSHGGGLLWCNARTPAVPFYERAGLVTRGEPWVDPVIGPHVAMEMRVDPPPPPPGPAAAT